MRVPGLAEHEDIDDELPRSLVAAGLLAFTIAGLLSGLLEALLVPLRIGTAMFPVAVALAIAGNAVLPRLSRRISPDNFGASAPVIGWTVAIVVLATLARPEGDIIFPGGTGGDAVVGYVLMIAGFVTGVGTVLRTASVALADGRRERRGGQPDYRSATSRRR